MKKINRKFKEILSIYEIEKEKEIKNIYDERLLFEGNYLEGKRKGRGKVFFNGILLIEDCYF